MAFQFVHATPNDIEYSAETRRRIRSQAMRDYRRRQRDEDNDLYSSPEHSPPSTTASPSLSSQSRSREESQRRQSSLGVQPDVLRRHSSGTSSDNPPLAHRAGSKRRSPQSPLEGEQSQSSQRRRRHNDEPRAQHGVFSQFMINLPKRTTPPTIGEDIEALNSPGRLEQMLDVCDDYNSWLTSTTPSNASATKDRGSYDDKTSQMLVSALGLKSIGHLEAVRPGEGKLEKNLLKTRVLALLNKRLKNPSKALEDNTIGALACLASYEVSQGSAEATMHLSGLQQILRLRGGTRKIGNTAGLCMLLEILDLTHAVYFQTAPMYTSADPYSQPSSTEETPAPPSRSGAGERGVLDQAMLDDISNFILSIPDLAETGEELPGSGGQGAQLSPVVTRNTFEEQVEQWYRYLADAASSSAEEEAALAYACRVAADVHAISTSAVKAHPMRIRAKTEELCKAIQGVEEEAWEGIPVLHIRVLLTALATTTAARQKSHYHAHLTRRLYQVEAEDWPGTKGVVLGFIEMQMAARGGSLGQQGIVRMAGGTGVEIVVEGQEMEGLGFC